MLGTKVNRRIADLPITRARRARRQVLRRWGDRPLPRQRPRRRLRVAQLVQGQRHGPAVPREKDGLGAGRLYAEV